MSPHPLTERQEAVWRFIASCDRSPSYFEIRDALNYRGIAGIQRALNRLEEYGYIARTKHRKRGIELLRWPDGKSVKPKVKTLSDWTEVQLVAELERRRVSRLNGSRRVNWMTDARVGSHKLLEALETAQVRP